jgi:hypothetical protein
MTDVRRGSDGFLRLRNLAMIENIRRAEDPAWRERLEQQQVLARLGRMFGRAEDPLQARQDHADALKDELRRTPLQRRPSKSHEGLGGWEAAAPAVSRALRCPLPSWGARKRIVPLDGRAARRHDGVHSWSAVPRRFASSSRNGQRQRSHAPRTKAEAERCGSAKRLTHFRGILLL